ncbi:MAG TPA: DNA ligase D [Fimbriimonas sp.]|nr:DNA ligase D [Fimbriimonas sp.]
MKNDSHLKENPHPTDVDAYLSAASNVPFPSRITPMLATLVDKPPSDTNWSYEIKWDGYRALALLNKGQVELKSRNDKSFNDKFYSVVNALKGWQIDAVIDGEIVVTNEKGISSFGSLQNWRSEADGLLIFYVFDILWLEGKDLTKLPLSERRSILQSVVPPAHDVIRLSKPIEGTGEEVFASAVKLGLEGIMAKRDNSLYYPGERSKEWLKIKANKRQEVVIGGYTRNEGSDKPFSSLLVGVFDGDELRYVGKIGTGFNVKTQKAMLEQFEPLVRATTPFSTEPDINSPTRFRPNPPHATATWLEPVLVCEVSFTEMTAADGVMRHPSFEGMRVDKKASDVVLERPEHTAELSSEHQGLADKNIIVPSRGAERKTLLNPTEESQVRNIDGHDLKFGNLSKLYWPEDHISKRDMLNYYYQVAPYILPYLKDRPQSLNRHPNGIHGKQFYQKDVKGKVPEWVQTFSYYTDADEGERAFFVCDDEASLLYLVSLGCIEISPWNSRTEVPDKPDWCVIDLDPDKNSFDEVIQAAQVTHEVFNLLGVPSYCKTSGATGIHIYVPLGAKYTYHQSKEFGRAVAKVIHSRIPTFTSIERKVADREGKMYIDFLQNRPGATLAAPYCLRPRPGAPVSMPLHWDEVKKGLQMSDFTIHNSVDRIKDTADLFKPVLGEGIDLEEAMKKLATAQ